MCIISVKWVIFSRKIDQKRKQLFTEACIAIIRWSHMHQYHSVEELSTTHPLFDSLSELVVDYAAGKLISCGGIL